MHFDLREKILPQLHSLPCFSFLQLSFEIKAVSIFAILASDAKPGAISLKGLSCLPMIYVTFEYCFWSWSLQPHSAHQLGSSSCITDSSRLLRWWRCHRVHQQQLNYSWSSAFDSAIVDSVQKRTPGFAKFLVTQLLHLGCVNRDLRSDWVQLLLLEQTSKQLLVWIDFVLHCS